jgi:hypothetical protein
MNRPLLKELVAAGAIRSVNLKGVPGGFILVVDTECSERMLTAQRGHARVFKQLNSATEFLAKVGVVKFCVDASSWTETSLI